MTPQLTIEMLAPLESLIPPKAKPKDWMLADTYEEARELYRSKHGHYPIGPVQSDWFEKHPEEAERRQMRKQRRSR
jgi:hypothetical protein